MGVPGFCAAVAVPVAEGLGAADVAVVGAVDCQQGSFHCHCVAGDAECCSGGHLLFNAAPLLGHFYCNKEVGTDPHVLSFLLNC